MTLGSATESSSILLYEQAKNGYVSMVIPMRIYWLIFLECPASFYNLFNQLRQHKSEGVYLRYIRLHYNLRKGIEIQSCFSRQRSGSLGFLRVSTYGTIISMLEMARTNFSPGYHQG